MKTRVLTQRKKKARANMEIGIYHQHDLHFAGGGSDKAYHAAIVKCREGEYDVHFAYGRRGSTLTYGKKTTSPVPLEDAQRIFNKLISEKAAKGYEVKPGISGRVFPYQALDGDNTNDTSLPAGIALPAQREKAGYLPQLLNPIPEDDIESYINDPRYAFQEKMNGERKIVEVNNNGEARGVNRKGFVSPIAPDIADAASMLRKQIAIDGEAIGNTLFAFDLLHCNGYDIRHQPYEKRYEMLVEIINSLEGLSSAIKIVPSAHTPESKHALIQMVRNGSGEGVVIKRLDAPYTEGRPNTGGDQLKVKFYETCSAVVMGVNTQRSVRVGVYDGDELINVGNVAIPVNKNIPDVGDVIEVRYLYAYKDGSLYQPFYEGLRTDIDSAECTEKQLKYFTQPAAGCN